MIRKRVKVDFSGLTEESTRKDGETESNTVSELTPQLAVRRSKESGKRAKDFIGSETTKNDFLSNGNSKNMKFFPGASPRKDTNLKKGVPKVI